MPESRWDDNPLFKNLFSLGKEVKIPEYPYKNYIISAKNI